VSTLALLVVLLLVVVVLLLAAVVGYAVHRRPAWSQPFAAAISVVALMVTLAGVILVL